jgi:transposase InsO family protein
MAAVWSITATGTAKAVSTKYTERLLEAGIEPSVGSVGDSYDNALTETIKGLYKTEVIHRRGPSRSFEAVEFANSARIIHQGRWKLRTAGKRPWNKDVGTRDLRRALAGGL